MNQKHIGTGLVALIVGFALGNITTPKGPDVRMLESRLGEKFAAASEASGDVMSGLDAKLDALTERLTGIEAGLPADTSGAVIDALSARIDALSAEMSGALSAAEARSAELASQLAALGSSAPADPEPAQAAPAPTAPEASPVVAAAAPAQPVAAADPGTPAVGLTAGMTALFEDGKIRAFVSRVDDATGSTRFQINGGLVTLAMGDKHYVESGGAECLLSLDGVDRGHAALSALCGADVPEPVGFGPGQTAVFGDGAVRVFVSGAASDNSAARLALNGLAVQSVPRGGSVAFEGCTLTVTGIDRNHVDLAYGC